MAHDTVPIDQPLAIRARGLHKVYRLYANRIDQALDILRLSRLMVWRKIHSTPFEAVSGIDVDIRPGERIGIIGRNGAGKTTFLKMITGAIEPTSGALEINGNVQALMAVGLGFHPDYTGLENIDASLLYGGLTDAEREVAKADIIEFCELGHFIDQPVKTYSLGMQSRLQFACATAIRPEILVVDEILGAGDAYFAVKSSSRMERLTKSGCTLILVSHAMQQVIQFTQRTLWIDQGKIKLDGESREVCGAYEVFMAHLTKVRGYTIEAVKDSRDDWLTKKTLRAHELDNANGEDEVTTVTEAQPAGGSAVPGANLVAPAVPLTETMALDAMTHAPQDSSASAEMVPAQAEEGPAQHSATVHHFTDQLLCGREVFRWQSNPGVKVRRLTVTGARGEDDVFVSGETLEIAMLVECDVDGELSCHYHMPIHTDTGMLATWITSPIDTFTARRGECRKVVIKIPEFLLGKGRYTLSISVFTGTDLQEISEHNRCDLLARCYDFVILTQEIRVSPIFYHPTHWSFSTHIQDPSQESTSADWSQRSAVTDAVPRRP